jgi:hypothetical protein
MVSDIKRRAKWAMDNIQSTAHYVRHTHVCVYVCVHFSIVTGLLKRRAYSFLPLIHLVQYC